MKRPLTPHDFTLLRDLLQKPYPVESYEVYVFGALRAWEYADWDAEQKIVLINDAGRQALHDLDVKLAREKAQSRVQAAKWDAEFAAENVAELEAMASRNPAAREQLEVATLAAEQSAKYAIEAEAALVRDDFAAVQVAERASNKAFQESKHALGEAARLVIKGEA